jgi:predicted MFS family arabinose efflux permease
VSELTTELLPESPALELPAGFEHPHRGLLPFLGLSCGISVASIYYNQPLLLQMSRTFHVPAAHSGIVAVATQIGYAAGIFAFVPLGDLFERRRLIVRLFAGIALSAVLAAVAPSIWVLVAASVLLGLTAAVTHVIIPLSPELADPSERGRAIGTVMTGLLLGILLARSAAGWVADLWGWRAVFYAAAAVNLAFVFLLRRRLPVLPPPHPIPWRQALLSLWTLFRTQPILRESSVVGMLTFAAFSAFWTTLVFLLGSPHYQMGAGIAGSFGLLGASGALIAPVAGRVSDRRGPRAVVTLAIALLILSFLILWGFGYRFLGLVAGVVVLDLGQQATQIANQTRIFSLSTHARGRINTVYMTFYFFGGSLGSFLSALAWTHYHWPGVCILGTGFLLLAALVHAAGARTAAT